MAKKYFLCLIFIAFAGGIYVIERTIFISRASSLANAKLDRFDKSMNYLDDWVRERMQSGDFFSYLGARAAQATEVAELNPLIEIIESALVLDNRDWVRVRSGRSLTLAERSAFKASEAKNILIEKTLLRRYALTDFSGKKIGQIVFVIKPPQESEVNFGDHDSRTVQKIIFPEGLIFTQIIPLPFFWQFYGLYFLMAVIVASVVYLIGAHAAVGLSKRERSERILSGYERNLKESKVALEHMATLATGEIRIEKLVDARVAEADIEERLAELRQKAEMRPEQAKKDLVISIEPSNRQFRFMNPQTSFEPRAINVGALSDDERRLRTRAFSSELKGLMDALAPSAVEKEGAHSKPDVSSLLADLTAFETTHSHPQIDQYLFYLNELYFDEVTERELTQAIHVAGETVQSREFAVLLYDNQHAVFRTGLSGGIAHDLKPTFFLLPRDTIIPTDFGDYGYVETRPGLKQNAYFKKRFPSDFTESLKGIHIFNITETYLRAKIVFFDRERGGGLSDVESINAIRSYLRQVAPGIHMFFQEASDTAANPRDLAEWAVKELKECVSLAGDKELLISQYVFESALPLDTLLSLTRRATHPLADGEKILLLSPSHLVIAHSSENRSALEEIVGSESGGRKFIVKEGVFARTTRNLYTFIEF